MRALSVHPMSEVGARIPRLQPIIEKDHPYLAESLGAVAVKKMTLAEVWKVLIGTRLDDKNEISY